MTTATQTTRMTQEQIPASAQVLARAFMDDPLMKYLTPEDARRSTALPWFMEVATKFGFKHGEVETTAGTVEGNAVWLPPGATHVPPLQMMMAGMYAAPFKLGWSNFMRVMGTMDVLEKLHKESTPEDHWYLMVLGVDPAAPRPGRRQRADAAGAREGRRRASAVLPRDAERDQRQALPQARLRRGRRG